MKRAVVGILALGLGLASLAPAQSRPELEARFKAANARLAEAVAEGQASQSEAGLRKLQEILDELKAIRRALDASPAAPAPGGFRFGGYVQIQGDDEEGRGTADGFRVRRFRIRADRVFDTRREFKGSLEVASGTTSSGFQLRDAYLIWRFGPESDLERTVVNFGAQPVPIGYEIERSSGTREFPERAAYNRVLFNGVNATMLLVEQQLLPNLRARAGAMNALTVGDAELAGRSQAVGGVVTAIGDLRYENKGVEVGLSGLSGRRPPTSGNSPLPEVDRQFVYLDGRLEFGPRWVLRAEGMRGRDRIPGRAAETELAGWHAVLTHRFGSRSDLSIRYQWFDRNLDGSRDLVEGYGLAYRFFPARDTTLTLAYERLRDGAPAEDWRGVLTGRVQLRF